MMKRIFLLIGFLMVFQVLCFAQEIKYSTHKIAKGETLSMIAAKYKSTVGDIMRLNGMNAQSQLKIGVKIKIPAEGTIVPPAVAAKSPAETPKKTIVSTHIVQQGETLYALSKKYGVSIDQIKEWNNMPDLHIEIGQTLAVSADGIAAANAAKTIVTDTKQITVPVSKPALQKTITEEQTTTEIKEQPIVPVPENKSAITYTLPAGIKKDGSDSYFANEYHTQYGAIQKADGDAMTFKTASGWEDKKYYILLNDAPAGSIVKITADNGNVVFAKVLWTLDEMKLNTGLRFRINEAAAAVLKISTNRFPLHVEYHQ
ncbi:LysM peptidoglycan-binding domain-containing protein [Limnovirga soli]|jgi:LysM repeat protein|uniref:LysM peptidoglycan-binding domain-containing protein n=1 Tax=Limnovirga soli TaxID=2656915 RepID=A0A8J8F9W0_9BACT|nr:LysM peptidoglycan-binding domain-containing protein [Limnovirga soli]NNV54011.1 LysM peptidoglycan-binding domain-containing protein [Limnovirga soli]